MSDRARIRGFTIIELLVSTTISVTLLALFAGVVTHIARTLSLTTVLIGMHDTAATFERTVGDKFQATHPCVAWHCQAGPGADGAWGTGDESVELTWWTSLPDLNDRGPYANNGNADFSEQDWFKLTWNGPKTPGTGSQLLLARTSGGRTSWWWGNITDPIANPIVYYLDFVQQPRRDRRRDMNDNDYRTIEGMTAAYWTRSRNVATWRGDADDLTANSRRLIPSRYGIEDFSLSWVDCSGWETRFDPTLGLCRRDPTGVASAWLGTPWSSQTQVDLDGLFVDARAYALAAAYGDPADPRDVSGERPALLRIAFTMRQKPTGILMSRAQDVKQRFSFSFPLIPGVPPPHSVWKLGTP